MIVSVTAIGFILKAISGGGGMRAHARFFLIFYFLKFVIV